MLLSSEAVSTARALALDILEVKPLVRIDSVGIAAALIYLSCQFCKCPR